VLTDGWLRPVPASIWSMWPPSPLNLLRALEKHFPHTIEILEGSFELIPGEFARQVLEAYRGSKHAVFQHGSVDPWRIAFKTCLTRYNLAFNAQRNPGWLASPAG
jgi:hypothetical protein